MARPGQTNASSQATPRNDTGTRVCCFSTTRSSSVTDPWPAPVWPGFPPGGSINRDQPRHDSPATRLESLLRNRPRREKTTRSGILRSPANSKRLFILSVRVCTLFHLASSACRRTRGRTWGSEQVFWHGDVHIDCAITTLTAALRSAVSGCAWETPRDAYLRKS